jgi:hypothetical protein
MEIHITKRKVLTALSAIFCGWLFFGIYFESGSLYFFLKHRPSFRVYFHDPQGERESKSLSDSEKRAAEAYHEFVSTGGYQRSINTELLVFPFITGSLILGFCVLWWRIRE